MWDGKSLKTTDPSFLFMTEITGFGIGTVMEMILFHHGGKNVT
jgi:hypothetical protein